MKTKIFMTWLKEIIKSILAGALMFGLTLFIFKSLPISMFLGIFTSYAFIGAAVTNNAKNQFFIFDFCNVNVRLSLVAIIISILEITASFFEKTNFLVIETLTWPLLICGVYLIIVSIFNVSCLFEKSR